MAEHDDLFRERGEIRLVDGDGNAIRAEVAPSSRLAVIVSSLASFGPMTLAELAGIDRLSYQHVVRCLLAHRVALDGKTVIEFAAVSA